MTNAEILLANAKKALEEKLLNSYEEEFIEKISDYSKKELSKLSSKQYELLRKCASK